MEIVTRRNLAEHLDRSRSTLSRWGRDRKTPQGVKVADSHNADFVYTRPEAEAVADYSGWPNPLPSSLFAPAPRRAAPVKRSPRAESDPHRLAASYYRQIAALHEKIAALGLPCGIHATLTKP